MKGKASALGLAALFVFAAVPVSCSRSSPSRPDYAARPVPFTSVEIDDGFWSPRLEKNRAVTVPYLFDEYEKRGQSDSRLVEAGSYLIALRPDLASRISAGRSLEDRDIFGIRITGPGGGGPPPAG